MLVEAGLTPLEALQAATLNPAHFLGKDQEFGTVEEGKRADLVLLDANPLEAISNTHKIAAVVVNGRLLDRAALDALLAQAEATATQPGGTQPPLPEDVQVVAPAVDLPPELAAYSGTWEGAWDNVLKSRLIVEQIDAEVARVIYAWADHPQGRFKGGWARVRAKVLPGGKLQWGDDKVTFTFEMAQDRMSIEGERENAGRVSIVTMRKVTP